MIQIFDTEKSDGLEEAIKNNISLSYASVLSAQKNELPELTTAALNDIDLFYLESILASVGWNLNDDVFDKDEVLKARNSSIHKKFNYMHDESDIIGHIVSSKIVGEDRVEYSDITSVPNKFDVLVGSVIYKIWEDEARQARINKIIAEINDGKWFVSMECLFNAFDYAIITPDNEHKVIARNKDSSFLTKYLRAYGGNGVYKDYKVGRLLRNFTFSGKGLVDNPGNPRSLILSTSNFKGDIANLDSIRENSMAENNELDVLKQKLEDAKARAEAAEKTAKEASEKELSTAKETIKTITSELATANQKVTTLQSNVEALTNANEELKTSKAAVEKQLKEVLEKAMAVELQSKLDKRLKDFDNKSVDVAKAKELVEKFKASDDDSWKVLVDSFANKNAKETTKANLEESVLENKTIPSGSKTTEEEEVLAKAQAWLTSGLQVGQKSK